MKSRIPLVAGALAAGILLGRLLPSAGVRPRAPFPPPPELVIEPAVEPASTTASTNRGRITLGAMTLAQLEAAFREVRSEPDPEVRRDRLRVLALRTPLSEAAAAFTLGRRVLPEELWTIYRNRLLELWAPRAPEAALAFVETVTPALRAHPMPPVCHPGLGPL